MLNNRAHFATVIMPSNKRLFVIGGLGDERGIEYLDISYTNNDIQ